MLKDIIWGLRWGLQMAAGFSLIAVVILAFIALVPGPPAELPVPGLYLFALYFGSGVISGTLVGVFRSKLANRFSANLVGILAAVPWYFGIRVLVSGWGNWSAIDVVFLVVAPSLVGTFVMQLIWVQEHRSGSS